MIVNKLNKEKWINQRSWITIVATVFLGLCTLNSDATSYTIENGTSETSTSQASPVNNYYKSYHLQLLYTADELYELGWTAGKPATISQLGFYITQAPTNALPNWTIKMKNTSAIDAASHDGTGLTTVYTVSSYTPTASTYDMRTFSTNFSWDGVSNILVDICWDIASAFSSTGKCRAYNYKNGGRYVRADSPSQCGVNTSTVLSYKPSVKLELTASTSAPGNDAICSATSLTVDGDCNAGTNYFGTTVSGDAIGSCWVASSKSHTVWYSFTAPSNGATDIYVEAFGYHTLTNTQVAVFSSSDNTCSGTLTAVGCDENTGTPGCTNCAFEQLTGLTSGNTYFIEVDGNGTDTGSFCISVLSAAVTFDNGGGDNKWSTATNWSNNAIPTSTTNVIINSGAPYVPSNTTAAYCNNLTVASTYTLRIESGTNAGNATLLSVYGDVTNDGTITHNGNYYMNLYGNNQKIGGSGTYTTTSGTGPGYSFADGSKVTLSSDLTGFNFINIDGIVELGSKTLQATNFTIGSTGQLKQNTGILELKDATPTFSGVFLPQQGLTYYNVSGATYDVDDVTEYYNLKLRCNSGFLVRQGGTTGYTCNNLELTNSGASAEAVINYTITITGNLTIGANCFLDLNDGTQRTMKVAGNITNNGTGFETPANGTLELNGSTTQTISGTAFTLNDVTVNNTDATGINLSTSVTLDATGILTLTDGIINTTSTNILTLGTGATVSGGDGSNASHISGPMDKNTNTAVLFKFPVGEEGIYKPIGVTPTANAQTFRCQAWNDNPNDVSYSPTAIETGQLNNVSTVEYWDVSRTSGPADAVTVRVYWASGASASGITDETSADLRVAHWKSSTSKWEDVGQSAISSANDWVEASGITSFSPFTLGSDGGAQNPLPVELISFDAKPKGNAVELTWVTASEKDNAYFEIQRSINGKDFERITTVKGAGNSITTIEYLTMDESPVAGTSYYQLKQVDFDGTSDYSKIATVNYKFGRNFELISISPSMASTFTQLTINVKDPDEVITYIYDNKGDLLKKDKHVVLEGYNDLKLDVSNFPTGVYYVTVNSSNEFINAKFIKSENYLY